MARYVIDAHTLVHVVAAEMPLDDAHQLVAVRRDELSERQALMQHERITEMRIRVLGDRVSRRTAWRIALEHGWDTVWEAEYLAITKLQADALITIDRDLIAKAADVVTLAPLNALTAEHE
jgi:predicted nucleic acid-binding protein